MVDGGGADARSDEAGQRHHHRDERERRPEPGDGEPHRSGERRTRRRSRTGAPRRARRACAAGSAGCDRTARSRSATPAGPRAVRRRRRRRAPGTRGATRRNGARALPPDQYTASTANPSATKALADPRGPQRRRRAEQDRGRLGDPEASRETGGERQLLALDARRGSRPRRGRAWVRRPGHGRSPGTRRSGPCAVRPRRRRRDRALPATYAASRSRSTCQVWVVIGASPPPRSRAVSAREPRSCALARCSRVLTVFSRTPSSRPASLVVSPSRTTACTTERNSGDRLRSAPARSPYSTPRSTSSSARRHPAQCRRVPLRHQHDVLALPKPGDQPPERDAPQPARDLAVAAERAGVLPQRDEGVLQDVGHDLAVVAPAHQPGLQPGSVSFVELLQRPAVRLRPPSRPGRCRPVRSSLRCQCPGARRLS